MLSTRDRRALKLGGAVLGMALLASFVVLPASRGFRAAREQLATERDLLARERDALDGAPATLKALRATGATMAAFAHSVFDAAEPELATLEVARLVEAIAGLSGTAAVRTAPLGIELDADDVTHLRVRVSGEAEFAQLVLLLHRLETSPALLRIDQLSIRSADQRALGGALPQPLLAFTLVVRGTGLADRAQLMAAVAAPPAQQVRDDPESETTVLAALVDDPFRPGLNIPGIAAPVEPLPEPAHEARATIAIVGTVVLPGDRGLVMAKFGTEPPRLLRVGDRIGGMRLRRVERGAAEFEDETGSRMTVRVPKPGV